MKKSWMLFLLFHVLSFHSAMAGGSLQVQLGQKSMNKADWEPLEKQKLLGLSLHTIGTGKSVGLAAQYLVSSQEDNTSGIDLKGWTEEVALGIYVPFSVNGSREFYGAGGLAFVAAKLQGSDGVITIKDDDGSSGFWLEGGANFGISEHLLINASLRYSMAKVTLLNTEGEAGGAIFKAGVGYSF